MGDTLIWYLYMCSRQESDHELAEREPLRQDHCLYSVSANVSRLPHFLFDKNANRHEDPHLGTRFQRRKLADRAGKHRSDGDMDFHALF
jgi:hypothetical protein